MLKKGAILEQRIRAIESVLAGQGFDVEVNERIFNEDGVQIAEYDIQLTGKVGSASYRGLIECRDRKKAQGVAWINELFGRGSSGGFNKVMAVSSSGFTAGAGQAAEKFGIELRKLSEVSPDDFKEWLDVSEIKVSFFKPTVRHVTLIFDESTLSANKTTLASSVEGKDLSDEIFEFANKRSASLLTILNSIVGELREKTIPELEPSTPIQRKVRVHLQDDCRLLTESGAFPVQGLSVDCEIQLKTENVPITALQYTDASGQTLSQIAECGIDVGGAKRKLSIHRPEKTGELILTIRTSS